MKEEDFGDPRDRVDVLKEVNNYVLDANNGKGRALVLPIKPEITEQIVDDYLRDDEAPGFNSWALAALTRFNKVSKVLQDAIEQQKDFQELAESANEKKEDMTEQRNQFAKARAKDLGKRDIWLKVAEREDLEEELAEVTRFDQEELEDKSNEFLKGLLANSELSWERSDRKDRGPSRRVQEKRSLGTDRDYLNGNREPLWEKAEREVARMDGTDLDKMDARKTQRWKSTHVKEIKDARKDLAEDISEEIDDA